MTSIHASSRGKRARAAALVALVLVVACGQEETPRPTRTPASFVGRSACAACHQEQDDLWLGSHHDLAMQVATDETVLGDFENASFSHFGITSDFFRRGDDFVVRTEGPDREPAEFAVRFVLGITPLQQYLVEFPGGRYQVLSLCWDTRSAAEGGQRWFHLYPDEPIPPEDPLHWSGPNHNWNFMCAECHSTDLRKNYDLEHDRYTTTWSEIDVSCEACHGPGSKHVAWADTHAESRTPAADDRLGFVTRTPGTGADIWVLDEKTGQAKRAGPLPSRQQIETCARCHSRRAVIATDYAHGRPLMDTHQPRLLDPGLYHADGQILDEVYVYGSFLQSRMYQEGVLCSDCHDPHSLELRSSGNGLCYRCHLPTTFDVPSHHHHEPGSEGAACVACHMPSRTYMVVDPRHDHGFRVPRPALSATTGAPNACNDCHTDQSSAWAADAVSRWYGGDRAQGPHWGKALGASGSDAAGAQATLAGIAANPALPGIVRGTALSRFRAPLAPGSRTAVVAALGDADPLVRYGALQALEELPPEARVAPGWSLLGDPVRAVRIEAARVLAPAWPTLEASGRRELEQALDEYVMAQLSNADRPLAHANIGVVLSDIGRTADAEQAYRTAMRLGPARPEPWVNLADLYRALDQDVRAADVLAEAVRRFPGNAEVHHALGLLHARRGDRPQALASLRKAADLRPDDPHLAYVYAVALNTYGEPASAISVALRGHERHPMDRELLYALATFHRDLGELATATAYAEQLAALSHAGPVAESLLQALRAAQRD